MRGSPWPLTRSWSIVLSAWHVVAAVRGVRALRHGADLALALAAFRASACPAALLLPLNLHLRNAGLVAAASLDDSSRIAAPLAAHATLSLLLRPASLIDGWPDSSRRDAATLALAVSKLASRRRGGAPTPPLSNTIASRASVPLRTTGVALLVGGVATAALPARAIARGSFQCVGSDARLPARAIRQAAASLPLLGCGALVSGESPMLSLGVAASSVAQLSMLVRRGEAKGLRAPVRATLALAYAACCAGVALNLAGGERKGRCMSSGGGWPLDRVPESGGSDVERPEPHRCTPGSSARLCEPYRGRVR